MKVLQNLLQSLQANAGVYLTLGHDQFILDTYHFII